MRFYLLFTSILSLVFTPVITAENSSVWIGEFSKGNLDDWEEKSFVGNTDYQLRDTERGKILHASSNGKASGLFRKVRVELEKTPYLNWSWRIENTFKGNDELTKEGDDYPARIYVVVLGGAFFWETRSINYVWSSYQQKGSQWLSAHMENAHMLAVQSGIEQLGEWIQEKRNVREDIRNLFGRDISHIDAVALMVDADNTLQSAAASFGDIYFSAH